MPLFEYVCRACNRPFEAFVTAERQPECPSCHGRQLDKQLSRFAVSTSGASARMTAEPAPCGACGDPRGAGACSLD
jgi:putative FmdB family regulatory protein